MSKLQVAIDAIVTATVSKVRAATEAAIHKWWIHNPEGGKCVVTVWLDKDTIYARVAVGASKEEQQASKPSEDAAWLGCSEFELPALN